MTLDRQMLDTAADATFDRIEKIVRSFLTNVTGVITADQELQELGLTSVDMVNMMLAIEAEFDVTIPGSKLIPANFKSIGAIDALMRTLGC